MELICTCVFLKAQVLILYKTHSCKFHIELVKVRLHILIIYMKKFLDYDWSRAMQLLCNSVQECVISCNYNVKANKSIKMQKFL